MMYKFTVEILSPEDHKGWVDDVVFDDEENAEKLGIPKGKIYSCGWTDSHNEDNDDAVYAMVDILWDHATPRPNSMHPQTFDPNSVVEYGGYKYFCTAGPVLFSSKDGLEKLAEDAGVLTTDYRGSDAPGTQSAWREDNCSFCDREGVIRFFNVKGKDDIIYCLRHLPQVVTAAVNCIKYHRGD
jgi:hypothetical protein